MESTQKTVYANYLQLTKHRNAKFDTHRFTTLNEKFGVNALEPVRDGIYPELSFITIGMGGHKDDGSGNISEVYHSPKHASLYDHIPFIMRPIENDLADAEVANYRLRVVEVVNGTTYASYYAKRLPNITSPNLYNVKITRSGITATIFIPDQLDLFPNPILTPPDFTQVHEDYIVATDGVSLVLTPAEVSEIINAIAIKKGAGVQPIISEIGICSGIDASFKRKYGSPEVETPYTDAHNLQINYFINVYYILNDLLTNAQANNSQYAVEKYLQIGTTEPVLEY